jgi:hypothetical protein
MFVLHDQMESFIHELNFSRKIKCGEAGPTQCSNVLVDVQMIVNYTDRRTNSIAPYQPPK